MAIKYNDTIGRFVNESDDVPVSQDFLKLYAITNPMEIKVGEPKLTKSKAPAKMVEGVESITIKERIK
jgi:hypothetical protein